MVSAKMNKFKGCRTVPEMSTKSGADKRQSGWIHHMQRFEWTTRIPPVYSRNSSIINKLEHTPYKETTVVRYQFQHFICDTE